MTMSRILIEPFVFDFFADSSSTLTTLMRWRLSWATTSSRDGASIVAVLSSPFTARAVYVYVGIVYLLGIAFRQVGTGTRERGTELRAATSLGSLFPLPGSLFPCGTSFLFQSTRQRLVAITRAIAVVDRHATDHAQE